MAPAFRLRALASTVYTLSRGHLRPPGRHERAPLAAEFPAPAHAQSGEPDRQDVALFMLEVLSADGQDGPDRAPPRRRTGGLNGCLSDDPADFVMVGDRIPDPSGRLRPGAGQGQVPRFLLGPGVRYQHVGEPLPHMAGHPVRSGTAVVAGRV